MKILGDGRSGAMFSDDGRYRYRLWRVWDPKLPQALFTMLNPSKADAVENDPTVQRQETRVRSWGVPTMARLFDATDKRPVREYGGIYVGNLFPVVSTDPQDMIKAGLRAAYGGDDGEENTAHILSMAQRVKDSDGVIVCGWGKHVGDMGEGIQNRMLLALMGLGTPVTAFKLNNDGTPCHPLYLDYELLPRRWDGFELHEERI